MPKARSRAAAAWPPDEPWDVIYIPIDPADIGRSYKAIIRINSQSGTGGVAYVLEQEFGFQLPKLMHKEIGRIVNDVADAKGTELTPQEIHEAFRREQTVMGMVQDGRVVFANAADRARLVKAATAKP